MYCLLVGALDSSLRAKGFPALNKIPITMTIDVLVNVQETYHLLALLFFLWLAPVGQWRVLRVHTYIYVRTHA